MLSLWGNPMTIIDSSQSTLPSIPGFELTELTITAARDGQSQPLIVGVPASLDGPAPLLVGIHTWSADYRQMVPQFAPLCARYGWLMVLPHFRGPNLSDNPHAGEAGGSLFAQHDVLDAVRAVQATQPVDTERLYLLGGSGGGHMSLLMAGKHPDLWAGVSAWCPVSDLRDWHAQGNTYAPHIEAVCGGAPGASEAVDFEYLRRSPRTFLTNAAHTAVQIAHGDKDPTIWVTQTWRTYEVLRPLPHRVEFRSWSGGHDLLPDEGFAWLSRQVKPREAPRRLELVTDEAQWLFWVYLQPSAPLTLARCEALAEGNALRLRVEGSRLTRVRLSDLGLPAPTALQRNGEPVACPVVADGLVELDANGECVEYLFTF